MDQSTSNRFRGRNLGRWICILPVCLNIVTGTTVLAQQQGYYVDDGRSITHVPNVDPETVKVERWEIRLYRPGQATSGLDNWGAISGESVAKVMAELRSGQEFEKRWCRWAETDYPDHFTYTNYLGPIAVVQPPKPVVARLLQQITNLYDRLKQARDLFIQIGEILSDKPGETNPFNNVGSVLKEYVDNLREAQKRLRELQQLVTRIVSPEQSSIDAAMTEIARGLAASERHAPTLARTLSQARDMMAGSTVPEGRFEVTLRTPEGEVRASDRHVASVANGDLEYTETYSRLYVRKGSRIEQERKVHCPLRHLDASLMTLGRILPFNSEDVVAWQITIPTKNMRKAVIVDRVSIRENGKEQPPPPLFDEDQQYMRLRFSKEQDARKALEYLRMAIQTAP